MYVYFETHITCVASKSSGTLNVDFFVDFNFRHVLGAE